MDIKEVKLGIRVVNYYYPGDGNGTIIKYSKDGTCCVEYDIPNCSGNAGEVKHDFELKSKGKDKHCWNISCNDLRLAKDMETWEMLKYLKNGGKARRHSWNDVSDFIYINDKDCLFHSNGFKYSLQDNITINDWIKVYD